MDLLYIAVATLFFVLIDWIVASLDERGADARR
jgi:hypothetical protein